MKRIICLLLTVVMLVGMIPMAVIAEDTVPAPPSFSDVKEGAWYADAVAYCLEKGYISGMSPTTFLPNDNLTRAQFLTILAKLDGIDLTRYEGKDAGFEDIKPAHWWNEVICWAVEKGYTSGISATMFGPGNNVTRAQVARFFYVYTEKTGGSIGGRADISGYPDAGKVAEWAKTPVEWAVSTGLISGVKKGEVNYLSPNGTATRAQAARMFMQYDALAPQRIVFWGDSVTQGILTGFNDVAEVPYPERVGEILGAEALNYGIGGEIGQQIACRQGGIPFYAYASETMPFTIPADTIPVEIELVLNEDGNPANIGNNYLYSAVNPMRVGGVLGELSKVEDTNIYTFTRLDAGEEVTFTELARVETFGMTDSRDNDITVLWICHNDIYPAHALPDLLETLDAMIAACPNDEYVVLGLMGERFVEAYAELNAGIKAHLEELGAGEKFLDVRSYLADPIHLVNLDITPTERDRYFMSNGWIPASLQAADELHLNQQGYDLLAGYVADKIIELGYLTN